MILRIVKMTFQEDQVENFLALFESTKQKISDFPGCQHLELWRDSQDPRIFFTYSQWESSADLANYRESELFKTTWRQTKQLFADKPQAWSVEQWSTTSGSAS